MLPASKTWTTPQGDLIYYQGAPLEEGPKPAIIYFAASGEASLGLDPFNQPLLNWQNPNMRTFSWDLPHHGPSDSFKDGMRQWALAFQKDPLFLTHFMTHCHHQLAALIKNQWIDPQHVAVAGLSRGAFIATHFATWEDSISTILGFAPLTQPRPVEEFGISSSLQVDALDLTSVASSLINKRLRFYIGNHDTRVGTDACYQFIRHLTHLAIEQGIRSPAIELMIYPSIGYKGHGTPSTIFKEGAQWLRDYLHGDLI
jgi:pimeloyl-ACP methyl ester carboxylesterase